MAEVITLTPTLADSAYRTRPHFSTYLHSDANAGGNSVTQIEEKRLQRQMKFPSIVGRKDVDSFKDPQNPSDPAYKKFNDDGDYRPPGPYRSVDNIIDPVSGFVSVVGDEDRGTGRTRIRSMVQLNTTPQSYTPQQMNSNRKQCPTAPPECLRMTEYDAGFPYDWNSRKVSDARLRADLGGWTSDVDPRLQANKDSFKPRTPADENKLLRDKLAHRYMYTSSTQRSYEEVPWDNILPNRQWAPVSTLEDRPDMISQVFTNKRYEPTAEEWQRTGRSWDWFQTRKGNFKTGIPIPGIVFCSSNPRAQQIPTYGGCVGGVNLDEIDNPGETFRPLTVKRVPIPRPYETSHRPNIPGYTGCTLYRSDTVPAHSLASPPEPMTTARVYRKVPCEPNESQFKRDSQMSKMVTTVPPCNPFNKIIKTPPTNKPPSPNGAKKSDAMSTNT